MTWNLRKHSSTSLIHRYFIFFALKDKVIYKQEIGGQGWEIRWAGFPSHVMGASAGRFLSGVMNILRIFWETSLSDQIPWDVWKLITTHTDQLMMKDSLTKYLLITHSFMQSPRLVMGPGGQFWYGLCTPGFHIRERNHVLETLSLHPSLSCGASVLCIKGCLAPSMFLSPLEAIRSFSCANQKCPQISSNVSWMVKLPQWGTTGLGVTCNCGNTRVTWL